MMVRNSLFTGSGASLVMTRRLSMSGRPALTPRTMMSTASGNADRNLASRRFLRNLSSHSGRPQPAAKPKPSAGTNPASNMKPHANAVMPSSPPVMKKRCFDQLNPACVIRLDSEADLARRSSTFFSVASICSRRGFSVLRAARAGAARGARPYHALAPVSNPAFFSREDRVEKDPGKPADCHGDQKEQRHILSIVAGSASVLVVADFRGGRAPPRAAAPRR